MVVENQLKKLDGTSTILQARVICIIQLGFALVPVSPPVGAWHTVTVLSLCLKVVSTLLARFA